MATELGFCSYCRTNVRTRYDWSTAFLIVCAVLILALGIGLLILLIYVVWVAAKGPVCSICGSKVRGGPAPGFPVASPLGVVPGPVGYYGQPGPWPPPMPVANYPAATIAAPVAAQPQAPWQRHDPSRSTQPQPVQAP